MFYTYTPNRALSHIFRFLKIRKFYLIKKRSFFKILKIRDSSLIETFIFNLQSKANRFYLISCLHDRVSRKPLFLPQTGKTWRHSDVIYGRRIRAGEFSFCQDVPNSWFGSYWKFGDDPFVTSGYIAERREGWGWGKNTPVSVAGWGVP